MEQLDGSAGGECRVAVEQIPSAESLEAFCAQKFFEFFGRVSVLTIGLSTSRSGKDCTDNAGRRLCFVERQI